jgi:probable phosphoglycerate mutase
MKITLHFVRHGQTVFNFEEKVQGWGDSFLTPEGLEGVKRLGSYWRTHKQRFDRIYSSDSGRTLQTARTIVQQMGVRHDIIPVPGLREYNFGYYEGREELTLEKDLRSKKVSFNDFVLRPETVLNTIAALDEAKKGGETNTWFSETSDGYIARLKGAISHITNESLKLGHKEVLIVSHGISIPFLLYNLCPEYWEDEKMQRLENASVSKAEYHNGKYKLLTFGEVKR